MHHACVYHEETHSLYIVPGQEPEESLSVDTGMYILDMHNYVWRKRIYNSLVSYLPPPRKKEIPTEDEYIKINLAH